MMRFQLPCPKCGEFLWFTGASVGQSTNCPECAQVFVPQAPPPLADVDGAPLALLIDPQELARPDAAAYFALSGAGITTRSSMATVRKVDTPTDEADTAWRVLKMIRSRLAIDLLQYPVWHGKESDDGLR